MKEQKIIRFQSLDVFNFDGMEGGPWRPTLNKEYIAHVESVDTDVIRIGFDNPDCGNEGGIEWSQPVPKSRIQIVGAQRTVVLSRYLDGYQATMPVEVVRFLEGEIESYNNTSEEAQRWVNCTLKGALGSLDQMDDTIFAEVMDKFTEGLDSDGLADLRTRVEDGIKELLDLLGEDTPLHDIMSA